VVYLIVGLGTAVCFLMKACVTSYKHPCQSVRTERVSQIALHLLAHFFTSHSLPPVLARPLDATVPNAPPLHATLTPASLLLAQRAGPGRQREHPHHSVSRAVNGRLFNCDVPTGNALWTQETRQYSRY
jgi:hypothetical protein